MRHCRFRLKGMETAEDGESGVVYMDSEVWKKCWFQGPNGFCKERRENLGRILVKVCLGDRG